MVKNKKGFTLVELVIVIAVIGVLAAVLIPTFSGVLENSKEKAAIQEASSAYTVYATECTDAGEILLNKNELTFVVDGYVITFADGNTNANKATINEEDYDRITVDSAVDYKPNGVKIYKAKSASI